MLRFSRADICSYVSHCFYPDEQMHSCEVAVAPPVQGAALLLELGTLIIEGRGSRAACELGIPSKTGQVQKCEGADKENDGRGSVDPNRGALPKKPALNFDNRVHSSPTKRSRDSGGQGHKPIEDGTKLGSFEDMDRNSCLDIGPDTVASTSELSEGLSVYDLKARLANVGRQPLRGRTEALWRDHTPLCIEVLLAPGCGVCREPHLLLERWTMSVYFRRNTDKSSPITSQWLLNAVRSQLHFSQISAWSAKLKEAQEHQTKIKKDELSPSERQRKLSRETCNFKKYESNCDENDIGTISDKDTSSDLHNLNVLYNLKMPEENYKYSTFQCQPSKHTFPITDIGSNIYLEVTLESLPRLEDVPTVSCLCNTKEADSFKRRKSKDFVDTGGSEDILARKLAVACSLAELNINRPKIPDAVDSVTRLKRATHSPDLGIINSDMGCSSGISRKFPLYSPEFNLQTLSSRGSTPERSDFNDSGYSCSKSGLPKEANGERNHSILPADISYHCNSSLTVHVPSIHFLKNNYLVDDRMQTPCSQKGKHRCNCDEESDQGIKDSTKCNSDNEETVIYSLTDNKEKILDTYGNSGQRFNKYTASFTETNMQEKTAKELPKYSRRHRKESRHKQLLNKGLSNQENTLTVGSTLSRNDRKNDLISNRKARTCSSSDNSDGRCSPELVHYTTTCHNCNGCKYKDVEKKSSCNLELSTNSSQKNVEISSTPSTTSIPILQASKFDHVNRFGNFRGSLHKSFPIREFYSRKHQNNIYKCDLTESAAKSQCCCQSQERCSTQISSSEHNKLSHNCCYSEIQPCYCENEKVLMKKSISDDDYRPSVKKLISSYTQTDDILCKCGRSLIPMCFECSHLDYSSKAHESSSWNCSDIPDQSNELTLKRSTANHDLAAINKSESFLEKIERSSTNIDCKDMEDEVAKLTCNISNGSTSIHHDQNLVNILTEVHDEKVIDLNCDNSISNINNFKCDNNRIYSDSVIKCSCTKDLLSSETPFLSSSNNGEKNNNVLCKENSFIKTSDLNAKSYDKPMDEKVESFIRKPKLKRYSSALDRVDKVILDRNNRKMKKLFSLKCDTDKILLSNHKSNYSDHAKKHRKARNVSENEEDHIIIYEKGDYGTFGRIDGEINERKMQSKTISNNYLSKSQSAISSDHNSVPSVSEMDKFRWILDSAASMVFHSRTGLPLTSSPAPLRRGKSSFDFDSSINSVSSIKSALYGSSDVETADLNPTWSPGSSPGSPSQIHMEAPIFNYSVTSKIQQQMLSSNKQNKFRHGTTSGLLGSFEESVLNGRLEPAATVAGFTAEIGASGVFCPPHLTLPVTVFFYSLGDNTTSSPYLGHINLGRKGYCVPRAGTIQVTLFNPHGTVVKMFVVMYDLEDMPPHSRTFLRQRTLWGGTCLRYLIHLRFLTSKSNKVYLHTDIRIIVSRKADLDTAAAHSLTSGLNILSDLNYTDNHSEQGKKNARGKVETGTFEPRSRIEKFNFEKKKLNRSIGCYELSNYCENKSKCDKISNNIVKPANSVSTVISKELSYELRSFTYGPENPKYSPR